MATKFMYLRATRDSQPVGCMAFDSDERGVRYQIAVLNPVDTFDRTRGRSIAEARLQKNPIRVEFPEASVVELSNWDVLSTLMSHLAASKSAPSRAVRTARHWLIAHTN